MRARGGGGDGGGEIDREWGDGGGDWLETGMREGGYGGRDVGVGVGVGLAGD